MSEPFLGMLAIYGFNFAPRGWAMCNGQILSIAQNTALFSLLGTTYGGNGQTTFALPDLRGRVPNHQGQGPGLSSYSLGQEGGTETVTLTVNELAQHTHTYTPHASSAPTTKNPSGNYIAATGSPIFGTTNDVGMHADTTDIAGGSQPHPILQPYLTLNFCIALEGIFPSRN
jgi:microcystin-dependent protein